MLAQLRFFLLAQQSRGHFIGIDNVAVLIHADEPFAGGLENPGMPAVYILDRQLIGVALGHVARIHQDLVFAVGAAGVLQGRLDPQIGAVLALAAHDPGDHGAEGLQGEQQPGQHIGLFVQYVGQGEFGQLAAIAPEQLAAGRRGEAEATVQRQPGDHVGRIFGEQTVALLAVLQRLLCQHLDQREGQRVCRIDFDMRPGQGFVMVGLHPGGERSARRNARSRRIPDQRLLRITGPAQGAQDARAEPHDEILHARIERRDHQAAGGFPHQRVGCGQLRQELPQVIRMEYRGGRHRAEGGDDPLKRGGVGGVAQGVAGLAYHHHRPACAHQAEQLCLKRGDDRVQIVRGADQFGQLRQQRANALTEGIPLQGVHIDQFQRDHPADEFVEFPRAQADVF